MDYKPLHRRAAGATEFVIGDPRIDQRYIVADADYSGETDAAPAVNAALAAGAAAGKLVYLRQGALRLHTPIMPRPNTGLVGAGIAATVLLPHGPASAIGTADNPFGNPNGWVMRDFEVDGINAVPFGDDVTVKGAYFRYARQVHIERILIRNSRGTGLGIDHITGSIRDVWTIDCGAGVHSDDSTVPGHSGIGIGCGEMDADWEPLTVENCHAVGSMRFGIFFESQQDTVHPSGISIIGCSATGSQDGFGLAGPTGPRFIGNHAYENRRSGVSVDRGTMGGKFSIAAHVQGNHLHHNKYGVVIDDGPDNQPIEGHVVDGNSIHHNTAGGIRVSAQASGTGQRRYVKITDNDVWANGGHGIEFVERTGQPAGSSNPFQRSTVDRNRFWNNTGAAVRVAHPTSGFVARGNQAWDDQATATQTHGFNFDASLTHSNPTIETDLMEGTNVLPT